MCAHRVTLDRRPRRRTLSRILAITAAGAMAASVVAVGQAPWAQAAKRQTPYSYTAFSYGTKVMAAAGELRSGRTAPAWVGCTQQAGRTRKMSQFVSGGWRLKPPNADSDPAPGRGGRSLTSSAAMLGALCGDSDGTPGSGRVGDNRV